MSKTPLLSVFVFFATLNLAVNLKAQNATVQPSQPLSAVAPEQLVVGEGFVDPLGFHDATPTFSWKLPVGTKSQTGYQIEVRDLSSDEIIWDSQWVDSDQSVFVAYDGPPLTSRQRLSWRVRFRDESENESAWSAPARFELGLLTAADWAAQWIRPDSESEPETEPVAYLRREFSVAEKVKHARLYATARGIYEVYLNGEKVGNDAFTPGWTSYANRIDTQTYDVTESVQEGGNALGAVLGYGWYAGRLGWNDERKLFGEAPALLLQLEITYQDGRAATIVSDGSWTATLDGPIRTSSIYDGETYDAHHEMPSWSAVGFDEADSKAKWSAVSADAELGSARLTPKPFPPVRVTETLTTQAITEPEPGRFVFDLGQNMVGWPLINISVEKNQTITLRFAEMLNPDGTMYTENYRSAKSIDFYTAATTGTVGWQPTFTFHGFRYVELSGFPADTKPQKDWVKGKVLHTELNQIGTFESSHEKLNLLQRNIVWGQRGNFLDIPTDCPQRDERCGWTGDAQAFCPTAMFNYDCHAFWKSWLGSMRDDQFEDGRIPHVIPDILHNRGGSPGWMDAATIIPWAVYVRTGDTEILSENFQMMERLVGFYRTKSKSGLVKNIVGFGDWLQPYADDNKGDTPHELLGTAFYANSVQILADSARVLGKAAAASKYDEEAATVREAFAKHYFDADGKLQNAPETQTAYILAIAFDLIPAQQQEKAAAHLVRLIAEADGHLRTGFLGTPFINDVLNQSGHGEVAFSVLFKETYPSWFYSINQGATTMWERWNSYSHEDGFGNVAMNSFNHYAYGAVGQFMVERIAGLAPDPDHPGYKHFFVRPIVGGPLTSAKAELETAYGTASSEWKKSGDDLQLSVTVPPNTTATIEFPDGRPPETVAPGNHQFGCKLESRAVSGFSAIKGTASKICNVSLKNQSPGSGVVTASIEGPQAKYFKLQPEIFDPAVIGDSIDAQVTFHPPANFVGIARATLQLKFQEGSVIEQELRGLSTRGLEGKNEAPLADILETLGLQIDLGWKTLAHHVKPELQGEEIAQCMFKKAEPGNVEILPLARYSPPFALPFGFYTVDAVHQGDDSNPKLHQTGVLADTQDYPEHQTLYPEVEDGDNEFDPGETEFGIYTTSPSHHAYSQDVWNAKLHRKNAAHACRIYPVRDSSGEQQANQFLVCFEEAANGDYQDYVFLLKNATPVSTVPSPIARSGNPARARASEARKD